MNTVIQVFAVIGVVSVVYGCTYLLVWINDHTEGRK